MVFLLSICQIKKHSEKLCFVTPSGFEPKSSEPESEILSIELWSRYFGLLDCWTFRSLDYSDYLRI